jgi:multiple sugar transport system permease protein
MGLSGKKVRSYHLGGRWTPLLLILPVVLILLVFKFYPLFVNVWYSLIDYKLTGGAQKFVGLENYRDVLRDAKFLAAISRTFAWTIFNILGMVLIGVPAAFLLNTQFKGKLLLKSCILIPWVLPEIVTGYTWKWMLMGDFGIINTILSWFHVVDPGFSWFRSGNTAMLAVVMANVWRAIPFVAVMVYAKLRTIPTEMMEAARIDGACGIKLLRYITFPHIGPVLSRVVMLAFIWTFNAFSIIASMTGGGPVYKTEIMPLIVQRTAFSKFEFNSASAMSIVMSLILLALMLALSGVRRALKSGKEEGDEIS